MRYSPNHKEETKRRLVKTSSAVAKTKGFGTTGVDELMASAGMTGGAFYGHFASKNDLLAAIIERELDKTRDQFATFREKDGDTALARILDAYLNPGHVSHPEAGCVLPSLTAEVARAPEAVQDRFDAGVRAIVDELKASTRSESGAWATLAISVGAVMVARALKSPALRRDLMSASPAIGRPRRPALAARTGQPCSWPGRRDPPLVEVARPWRVCCSFASARRDFCLCLASVGSACTSDGCPCRGWTAPGSMPEWPSVCPCSCPAGVPPGYAPCARSPRAGRWTTAPGSSRRACARPPRAGSRCCWPLLTVTLTGLACLSELRSALDQRLRTADSVMARLLQEIEGDLERLDQGRHDPACDAVSREALTRQAFTSTLVREFMYRSQGQESLCTSFGLRQPEWAVAPASGAGLQILATQSLTSSIIVIKPSSAGEHVAVITPRQMLDRLPGGPAGQTLKLQTSEGRTLASVGTRRFR